MMRNNPFLGKPQNITRPKQQRTVTSVRTTASSAQVSSANAQKLLAEKNRPKILDEANNDVTPKPLFDIETNPRQRTGSGMFQSLEGGSTPTDVLSNGSILNTNNTNQMLTNAQSFGGFPENSTHVSNDSNQIPGDSMHDGVSTSDKDRELPALFIANSIKSKKFDRKDDETKTETINLKETSTFVLLDICTLCLSNEDPNLNKVKENNQKYAELVKSKIGNDSYVNRAINTFNDPPKIKTTQTDRITINEKGVWCTAWDMHDTYNSNDAKSLNSNNSNNETLIRKNSQTGNENSNNVENGSESSQNKTKSSFNETATGTVISNLNANNQTNHKEKLSSTNNNNNNNNNNANVYLESPELKLNSFFMERLINQNTYQSKQAKYRGLKQIDDELSKTNQNKAKLLNKYDGISLEKLWTYACSLTKDRNVSCMSWNKKNKDILAVGYGKFEYNDDPAGLVCCWCLKNPEFPERFYKTEAGVTSLAFSQKYSNLLAVGLFNGNILVFDVRNNNTAPLLNTNESEHKHLSPVWNLKWTDRSSSTGDAEEMEVLMSISSDGRVTQWMIRKGFESTDYLKLKRVSSKKGPAAAQNTNSSSINQQNVAKKEKEKNDGFISRYSGGLTFDIWDQDKLIYLCGTEEGSIHRCSTSYNEQYLDTYYGHTGPVYKILWSPFLKNAFISASADWTIRLWKNNRTSPCLTFNSSSKSVFDICWSNNSATMFCCVNESTIEIWDLSKSTLDPIYSANPSGSSKLTTICCSPNSDCLIAGTNEGGLLVYAMKNMPEPANPEQLEEIIKQSLISQLENIDNLDEEDEDKEALERHQLDALNAQQQEKKEIQDENEKIEKLNAFEAKLDKIKKENENILRGQGMQNKKAPAAKNNSKKDETSDSSDEN